MVLLNTTCTALSTTDRYPQNTRQRSNLPSSALNLSLYHLLLNTTLSPSEKMNAALAHRLSLSPESLLVVRSSDRRSPVAFLQKQFTQLVSVLTTATQKEDTEESAQFMITQAMSQLDNVVQEKCRAANVKTFSEYQEKSRRIALIAGQAAERCYRTPEYIEKSVSADEAMTVASRGRLSAEDRNTIRRFWELVSKEGHAAYEEYEERFAHLFTETMLSWTQNTLLPSSSSSCGSVGKIYIQQAEQFSKMLYSALKEKRDALIKELVSADPREQILLKYLLLQGDLQAPSLVNMMIRKKNGQLAEDHADDLQGGVAMHEKFRQDDIKRYEKEIDYEIDRMKWAKKSGKSLLAACKEGAKRRNEWRALLEAARARDPMAEATKIEGSTSEILAYVPPDTAYEQTTRRICFKQLEQQAESSDALANVRPEMRMAAVTTTHFMQQMQQDLDARHKAYTQLATASAAGASAANSRVTIEVVSE